MITALNARVRSAPPAPGPAAHQALAALVQSITLTARSPSDSTSWGRARRPLR